LIELNVSSTEMNLRCKKTCWHVDILADNFGSSRQKCGITIDAIDVNWLELHEILNGKGNVKINRQVL